MSDTGKSFTTFVLDNAWNVEFPTEPAGVLRLGPGQVRIQANLTERYRREQDWYTVVDCELRVADAEGKVWQATGTWLAEWLVWSLIDLSRAEPGRWVRNAPEEWRTALQKRILIREQSFSSDSRGHCYFWLDNTAFDWYLKYWGIQIDVAALSTDQLVVQLKDSWSSWGPVPVAGADGSPRPVGSIRTRAEWDQWLEEQSSQLSDLEEAGDEDECPPVAYLLDAGRLLFRNTAFYDEQQDDWEEMLVNRPLVFSPCPGKDEPQRIVTFHPGEHLAGPSPSPADEAGFVPFTCEHYYQPLELLTDRGGELRIASTRLAGTLKLDRHPGSNGPEDVLRCQLRLTDAVGDVWEGCSHFTPEVFFEEIFSIRWERPDFESQDSPWQPVEGSLLDIRATLDDGRWRYALLDHDLIAFHASGQRPLIDVAPTGQVRIRGLIGRQRPFTLTDGQVDLFPPDRPLDVPAWENDHLLPPICHQVSLPDLCFRNTTFAVDEGFWNGNAIPIPVVFTRVGKGEPNAGIRFVPDAT
jgi:hypothetical protein